MHSDSLGVWNDMSVVPASAGRLIMTSPQVKRAQAAIHRIPGRRGPNITVWYGSSGLGKSAATWILCRTIREIAGVDAAYLDAPTPRGGAHDERMVMRSILASGVGRIPDAMFRSRSDEELADMILTALFAREIRLLVIDEAGRLGYRGLEAIGRLVDRAVAMDEDFHVVLVGMSRFPETLNSNPRVRSRVAAWEQFDPLTLEAFGSVLVGLYPEVLGVRGEEDQCEAVEGLYAASSGNLREALSVLSEVSVLHAAGEECGGAQHLMAVLKRQRQSCEKITAQSEEAAPKSKRAKHHAAFARAEA